MTNRLNRYRKRAVAYARYSSTNQREESIDAQLRAIREYCKRNDIELIEIYTDEAKTGTNDDRDNFQLMINDINSGEIDVDMVLVHRFNRFARSTFDSAVYKHKLKQQGVRVVSVTQNIEETPEGEMMEKIIEAFDEYFSKNLAAEVQKGLRENAIQGRFIGGKLPLGFDIDGNGFYVQNESAEIVRRIFTEYAAGVTKQKIVDGLNLDGIKNQYGGAFKLRTIRDILVNEKYIGNYVYKLKVRGKTETIRHDGFIKPPIIDRELWDNVQKIRTAAVRPREKKNVDDPHYLTGRAFCAYCGHNIVGGGGNYYKSGKVLRYYRCVGKITHAPECILRSVNKKWLEGAVVSEVLNYVSTKEFLNAVTDVVWQELNAVRKQPKTNTQKLNAELTEIAEEQKRLTRLFSKGKITEELFDEENEPLTDRRAVIEHEIKKRKAVGEVDDLSKEGIYNYIYDYVKQVTTSLSPADADFIRAVINEFVEKVVIDNDNVTVFINSDFFLTEKSSNGRFAGAIHRLKLDAVQYKILRPKPYAKKYPLKPF